MALIVLKKFYVIILLLIFAALVTAGIYLALEYGLLQRVIGIINEDLSDLVFLGLFLLFPIVGFPVSVFLVVCGIKFGVFYGILLWLLILPLHTTIAYLAAAGLRPFLEKLLSRTLGYKIPAISHDREALFSFIFLAIPGIPYAVKNYLLPLAGVSFRYCVLMNCVVQSFIGLPFILLGKSGADMDLTFFYLTLLTFMLLFFLVRKLKKKYIDT